MKRRICVRGIILDDSGKIFCVKQNNSVGQVVDYWCTPGGGLDVGEPILIGLKRELVEETGVAPKIGNLLLIQQFIDSKGREQMELFFHIQNPDDYKNIDLTRTTHGHIEINEFDFLEPSKSNILPKIITKTNWKKIIKEQTPTMIINEIPKGTKITVEV